jgi:hypothetical protein
VAQVLLVRLSNGQRALIGHHGPQQLSLIGARAAGGCSGWSTAASRGGGRVGSCPQAASHV